MNWTTLTAAIVGGLGGLGGLAAFAQAITGRAKIKADAANVLTDSALEILRQVQDREILLQSRVRELEEELNQLHRRVWDLEHSLADRDATILEMQLRGKK